MPGRFREPAANDSDDVEPDFREAIKTLHSDWYYGPLAYPVAFSGGVLLGRDFIAEMYVHMGFHPAYKYREVHELVFEDGRLAEARDCSAEMQKFREQLVDAEASTPERVEDLEDWVRGCFRMDYGWLL